MIRPDLPRRHVVSNTHTGARGGMVSSASERGKAQPVSCPICDTAVPADRINDHIDASCDSGAKRHGSPCTPSHGKRRRVEDDRFASTEVQSQGQSELPPGAPLAELARPHTLDDFFGQHTAVGESSLLRDLIRKRRLPSLLLWGPPGCGKTCLARIIARSLRDGTAANKRSLYRELSGVTHGVADVKQFLADAAPTPARAPAAHRSVMSVFAEMNSRKTGAAPSASEASHIGTVPPILFLDEIHRFTKAQQDVLLPAVERGDMLLLAATTENPSFRVNNALLSRCRVVPLAKLQEEEVVGILRRAARIKLERDRAPTDEAAIRQRLPPQVLQCISRACDGDARTGLNVLEMAMNAAGDNPVKMTALKDALQRSHHLYDRNGEGIDASF